MFLPQHHQKHACGKTLRKVFLFAVGILTSQSLHAQESNATNSTAGTPRPKISHEAVVPIEHGGYHLRVFASEGDNIEESDVYLYYEPVISIMKDETGKLEHAISQDSKLILRIRWDTRSDLIQERIRKYFSETLDSPSKSWVINPIVVQKAWFESWMSSSIRSKSLPINTGFGATGVIPIYFEFPNPESATDFVNNLQAGNDQLIFRYSFSGVSTETCTASASYEDIQEIEQFKNLVGEGDEGYAQRHQLAQIAQEIGKKAKVDARCSDAKLLREMANQAMTSLGDPESKPWEQIRQYANLDQDLKTAVVNSIKEVEQRVDRDQNQEAFSQAVSEADNYEAGGGYGPFVAALSGSFASASKEDKQTFSDILKKHGISGEWIGKNYIPKNLDVYSVEEIRSKWANGIQITYELPTSAEATFPVRLTKKSWIHGEQTPDSGQEGFVGRDEFQGLMERIEQLEQFRRNFNSESVENRLNELSRHVHEPTLKIQSGTLNINAREQPELGTPGDCQTHRGRILQFEEFDEEFHEPPEVYIALSRLGTKTTGNFKIGVTINDVFHNGFIYTFSALCEIRVFNGFANWIALGY